MIMIGSREERLIEKVKTLAVAGVFSVDEQSLITTALTTTGSLKSSFEENQSAIVIPPVCSIREASRYLSCGRNKIFGLLRDGTLEAVRPNCRKTLILKASIANYLNRLRSA